MVKTTNQCLSLVVALGAAALLVPACNQTEPFPNSKFIALDIDKNGAFDSEELDVRGNWYVYGDAYGDPRSCIDVGHHDESVCSKECSEESTECSTACAEDPTVCSTACSPVCSTVAYPETHLPNIGFPNVEGKMCVSGVVARLVKCCTKEEVEAHGSSCLAINELNCAKDDDPKDHSNLWGAGMGFDLDLELAEGAMRDYKAFQARTAWNAADHQVIGIEFELEWHGDQEAPLRIEFPIKLNEAITLPDGKGTVRLNDKGEHVEIEGGEKLPKGASTEEHPYGSPFWQTVGKGIEYMRSPIVPGTNTIFWKNVFAPPPEDYNYMGDEPFLGEQLLGVQFHVIPDKEGDHDTPFSFCISNFRFLTE